MFPIESCWLRILLSIATLSLANADLTVQVFNLTQDNPSYAIHGLLLQVKQAVQIESCETCVVLVDVTLRRYNNIPFTINNFVVNLDHCSGKINDSIDYMTVCQFQYSSRVLLTIGNSTENEFGIGVRVLDWVNKDVLSWVYPLDNNPVPSVLDSLVFLGDANHDSVATFLAPNTTFPFMVLETLDFWPKEQADTCWIQVLAGGQPSTQGNKENVLLGVSIYDNFIPSQIFTTAFSVYVPKGCSARIGPLKQEIGHEFIYRLDVGRFVITSPEFPWQFDNPNDHFEPRNCYYELQNRLQEVNVDLEIDGFQGGNLSVFVEKLDATGKVIELGRIDLYEDNPMEVANVSDHYSGQLVAWSWSPSEKSIRKGFVLRVIAYNIRDIPTLPPTTADPNQPTEPVTDEVSITTTRKIQSTTTKSSSQIFGFYVLVMLVFRFSV